MTREEYLLQLKGYLTQCSAKEAQDLLDDVASHFDEAAEFGLSEDDICTRLGDPKKLAEEYIQETPVHAQATATIGTQRGEYENVHQFTAALANCNIELFPSETATTIIDIVDAETNDENRIEAIFENGHLRIRQRKGYTRFFGLFGLMGKKSSVKVWLGKDFAGDLKASAGSGSIYVTGASANNFSLTTGSGSIQAVSIGANQISAKAGSGNITLSALRADKISAVDGSGTIRMDHLICAEIVCNVASGSIKIDETGCQQAALTAASGSIRFDCTEACNVRASTASGSIHLYLPPWQEMTINTLLASGKIDIGYPASSTGTANKRQFIVGSGANTVNCQSASGSIHVLPREQ